MSDLQVIAILDELRALRDEVRSLREEILPKPQVVAEPEHYPLAKACEILGGISRSTAYREIEKGLLERVPGIRRVLITRRSIERRKIAK